VGKTACRMADGAHAGDAQDGVRDNASRVGNMVDESKSAVVTGVSSGIGRAIAACLVDDGWRVFGSVRKEKDADAAREALGPAFTPLIFDVTDDAAIAAAAEQVNGELAGKTLDGLVNNAGISAICADRRFESGVRRQRQRCGPHEPGVHTDAWSGS